MVRSLGQKLQPSFPKKSAQFRPWPRGKDTLEDCHRAAVCIDLMLDLRPPVRLSLSLEYPGMQLLARRRLLGGRWRVVAALVTGSIALLGSGCTSESPTAIPL